MKKLFQKIFAISLLVLLELELSNVQPAKAEPADVQLPTITTVAIKSDTPTKIPNSLLYLTQGQTLEFDLLDAYGNPVNYGNYTGTATISGMAFFENYGQRSQTEELKIKNGRGKITFYVRNYYLPGEIIITPHFRTLLNKPFTEKLYTPGSTGNATQVVLKDQPQSTYFNAKSLFSDGKKTFLTYKLQTEDALDNPTSMNAPANLTAEVTYNGKTSTAVKAIPLVTGNGTYTVSLSLTDKGIEEFSQIPTGTYTVTITPDITSKIPFAPLTETFIITAD